MEKNVHSSRIIYTPPNQNADYMEEVEDKTQSPRKRKMTTSSSSSHSNMPLSSISTSSSASKSVKDIFTWIQQLKDDGNVDDLSEVKMDSSQLSVLFSDLTAPEVANLVTNSPEILEILVNLLSACVTSDEIPSNLNLDDRFSTDSENDGLSGIESEIREWLKPTCSGGDFVAAIQRALTAGCVLLRIMTYVAISGMGYTSVSATVSASEEVVARTIYIANSFISHNILVALSGKSKSSTAASALRKKGAAGMVDDEEIDQDGMEGSDGVDTEQSGSDDEDSVGKRKKKKLKKKSGTKSKARAGSNSGSSTSILSGSKFLLQETCKIIGPFLRSLIWALESFLLIRRQSDRICMMSYELAVNVLRVDVASNPRAICLDVVVKRGSEAILTSTHIASIHLLRGIFKKYPSQRQAVIHEMLLLFAQTYSPRQFSKTYTLYHYLRESRMDVKSTSFKSGSDFHTGATRISMSFAALMIMLQSAVNTADGLASHGSPLLKKKSAEDSSLQDSDEFDSNIHVDISKGTLEKCVQYSSLFVTELFARCLNKDSSSEYRTVASALLQETLVAIHCPHFPIVSIFFSRYLNRLLADFNRYVAAPNQDKHGETFKKDPTFVTFVMDLFGHSGAGMRRLLMDADGKAKVVDEKYFSNETIKRAIMQKMDKLCPNWMTSIEESDKTHAESRTQSTAVSSKKNVPKNKGKGKSGDFREGGSPLKGEMRGQSEGIDDILSHVDSESTLKMKSGNQRFIDLGVALSIGSQIQAISLEPMITYQEEGVVLALPANKILSKCASPSVQRDVVSRFPQLDPSDEHSFHIASFLDFEQGQPIASFLGQDYSFDSTTSHDVNTFASFSSYMRDAYEMSLAQWQQAAFSTQSWESSRVIFRLMNNYASTQTSGKGSSSMKPTSASLSRDEKDFKSVSSLLVQAGLPLKCSLSILDEGARRQFLSYESVQASFLALLADRCLKDHFDMIIKMLISLFSDPSPIVRARVVRTVSVILDADPELICDDLIRDAVTERFNDVAISVREEAVKLVGSFVLRGYDIDKGYIDGLLVRLKDKGVSVRKSVVAIIRDILLYQPGHKRYAELCLALLERSSLPKEEESIKEVVRATFQQLWFLPPSNKVFALSSQPKRQLSYTGIETADTNRGDDDEGISQTAPSSTLNLPAGWVEVVHDDDNSSVSSNISSSSTSRKSKSAKMGRSNKKSSKEGSNIVPQSPSNKNRKFISPRGEIFYTYEAVLREAASESKNSGNVGQYGIPEQKVECSSPSSNGLKNISEGAGLVKKSGLKTAAQDHVRATSMQIVDVMTHLESPQWLVALLRDLLHGNSKGDEASAQVKQRRQTSFVQCDRLVSTFVDMLLAAEENNSATLQALDGKRSINDHIVAIISALAVFSEAHPPLTASHLHILLPYLKGDSGLTTPQEELVCLKITDILAASVVMDGVELGTKPSELASDLSSIALKFGGRSVDAAIGCLAQITQHHTRDPSALLGLAEKCFSAVVAVARSVESARSTNPSPQHIARLVRSLVVLGMVCKHSIKCSQVLFASDDNGHSSSSSPSKKNGRHIHSIDLELSRVDVRNIGHISAKGLFGACYSAASFALKIDNVPTRMRALQCLCGVFVGCPRLMMVAQEQGILTSILGNVNTSEQVLEKFLVSLKEMMLAEEARLEAGQALQELKESGIGIGDRVLTSSDADADTTVAGFVLQQHLHELLALTSHQSVLVRLAAMDLIGVMLRQGMVCPLDVIGNLVAMQGDEEILIRRESLRLLQIEDEKHPSFLDSRIISGIEQCHSHQRNSTGEVRHVIELEGPSLGTCTSVFTILYTSCLQQSRKRRTDLLIGLLKRITNLLDSFQGGGIQGMSYPAPSKRGIQGAGTNGGKVSSKNAVMSVQDAERILSVCNFLVSTLAHLSYDVIEEPLHIIYWINRNVPLQAGYLLSQLKEDLIALGAEERKEGGMQPPAVGSAPTKRPGGFSTTSASSSSGWEEGLVIDEARFAATYDKSKDAKIKTLLVRCLEARGRESLIRLKAFLKNTYNLSDERCLSFTLDDKGSQNEKIAACARNGSAVAFQHLPSSLPASHYQIFSATEKTIQSLGGPSDWGKLCVRVALSDYNRLLAALEGDPEDFTLTQKKKSKGGRKKKDIAAGDGEGAMESDESTDSGSVAMRKKRAPAKSKAKPKKKRRNKKFYGSSDDDEEDEVSDDQDDYA